ncbi:MAG TPA: class III extradiol ring-cleavage dioxygenase, partial [Gammaproteobacteria bacterium]
MPRMPALFVSHGAPTLLHDACPARDFLAGLGAELPRPRAVVCVSAHWTTRAPAVGAVARPVTVHDFYGFHPELYEVDYPAPGDPELAARVAERLAGLEPGASLDPERGLDHGAWVPLRLIYPEADLPVVQLSVQPDLDPAWHLELGRRLRPLRDDGVLLLASGGATHNLRDYGRHPLDAAPPAYAAAFADWLAAGVAAGDLDALVEVWARAPEARRNHPTPEHLLPFHVALGG